MSVKIKKRKQQRVDLTNYLAVFTEDNYNYTGTLKEISLNGLRITICPIGSQLMSVSSSLRAHKPMNWSQRKFRIIISENMVNKQDKKNTLYRVTAYPRWQRGTDNIMEVGFEIPESSADWKKFVQQRIKSLHSAKKPAKTQ